LRPVPAQNVAQVFAQSALPVVGLAQAPTLPLARRSTPRAVPALQSAWPRSHPDAGCTHTKPIDGMLIGSM